MTALVTGFPTELRQPKPLPGETLIQLVIRNHPQEWNNCLERLTSDHGVSAAHAAELRKGNLEGKLSPAAEAEIERFMNYRLPTHFRTLQELADIRNDPMEEMSGFALTEILWPREQHPSGQREAERMAEEVGATVIPYPSGTRREIDLAFLLSHIHGDLLWLVPGGTKMTSVLAMLDLMRIVKYFAETPDLAMYMDAGSSVIYRVSALRDLLRRGQTLSPETVAMGRALELAGYRHLYDGDPDNALCELEPEYGGRRRKAEARVPVRRAWWKRLFRI